MGRIGLRVNRARICKERVRVILIKEERVIRELTNGFFIAQAFIKRLAVVAFRVFFNDFSIIEEEHELIEVRFKVVIYKEKSL